MSSETESERINRIREAQIGSRDRAGLETRSSVKKPVRSKSKQPKVNQPINAPTAKLKGILVARANTTANAVRDIAIGAGIGLFLAILAFIFLPGAFKLLAILTVLVGGVIGYLLGETAP